MKRCVTWGCLLALMGNLAGCKQHRVQGDGVLKQKTVTLAHFDRLSLRGNFKVNIHVAEHQRVTLRADSNVLPLVNFHSHQGFLKVSTVSAPVFTTKHPMVLDIGVRQLNQLDLTGASQVRLQGVNGERLIVNVNGAARSMMAGKVSDLDINIIGTGRVDAHRLVSSDCEVNIAGAGRALVHAAKQLSINVSGVGKVTYYGHPRLHSTVSGAAKVRPA